MTRESGKAEVIIFLRLEFLNGIDSTRPEPHNMNCPDFLGEINIDKEQVAWRYIGDKLESGEQKQVADFIIDYRPADGVY